MTQATYRAVGRSIDYTPGAAVSAGDVVVQNNLVGIAAVDIEANRLGALHVEGIFDVAKASGGINAGASVFWDADGNPLGGTAGTGAATTTAEGNTYMGWAVEAAGVSDTTVRVLLVRSPSITVHEPLTAALEDPGDEGAIPVTGSGHVVLVTEGAETRTLAAPEFVGQQLMLVLSVDGGDCVVTCATGLNQTGNDTATFGDAGDTLVLVAIDVGGSARWRVMSNDGVSLTTA